MSQTVYSTGGAVDLVRCTTDTRIRRYGYRIHARPKNGEPVWESAGGNLLPQSVVLRRIADALKGVESR